MPHRRNNFQTVTGKPGATKKRIAKARSKKKKAPKPLKTFTSRHLATKHARESKSKKRFKVLQLQPKKFAIVRKGSAFF